jgi:hypothetical protein
VQKFTGYPPDIAAINQTIFFSDHSGKSFGNVLFYGAEYDLIIFDIMVYPTFLEISVKFPFLLERLRISLFRLTE